MTRPQDAALAAEIGASYVGVIFAKGPRTVSTERAREILAAAGPSVRRVGVFDTNDPERVAEVAEEAGINVVQLHADPMASDIEAIRHNFGGEIWAAIHIAASHIPHELDDLFDLADGVLLDAHSENQLGGTGKPLQWNELAVDLARDRGGAAVVLAGGPRPATTTPAPPGLAPRACAVSSGSDGRPGSPEPR